MADPEIIALSTESFHRVLSTGVSVVAFCTTHCAPCKAMAPEFARAAAERPGWRFCTQNISEHLQPAFDLGIVSVPSVGVFSNGELIGVTKGPRRAGEILAEVDRIAAGA